MIFYKYGQIARLLQWYIKRSYCKKIKDKLYKFIKKYKMQSSSFIVIKLNKDFYYKISIS